MLLALAVLVVSLGIFLSVTPPLMAPYSFSRAVYDREGRLLRLTLSKDQKYRLYTPLAQMSPSLVEGTLLHEDQFFYSHHGVNPASLARAFWQTYFTGGRRIGASTISMQLARLRFGITSRHLPGKLWQMLRALQLELHYSKQEILEAYLNLAPYGQNIEGVGAASRIYFGRHAAGLTLPESLSLAVIPQSPARRAPIRQTIAISPLKQARDQLFAKWLERHPEDQGQAILFRPPLAARRIADLPFEAPHFVNGMLKASPDAEITTTLDLPTQQLLERLVGNYAGDHAELGIHNASALLVDYTTMQVIASVGSADFSNAAIHGQVDGTRARRSPGSTLKPFIYALAFEQGLIHPASLLKDAPTSFGAFNPENFDRDYNGPISVHDALIHSRNIPALTVASELKGRSFYDFLKQAKIGGLRPEKSYGLSLVLGGAEVTMRELAGLYAMLANGGQLKPLAERAGEPVPHGEPLLSPEASFLALDILKDTPRPLKREHGPNVYWKTGTSNGFRDAWTAGVFGDDVLVVWIGNFGGAANPSFVGVRTAAPLFFQLVDAVDGAHPAQERVALAAKELKLRRVKVCAVTGDIADALCPTVAESWFIPGVSPIRQQTIYRRILVDRTTGKRDCRFVAGMSEYRTAEFWPSDLRAELEKAGIRKDAPPPLKEECGLGEAQGGSAPHITSPLRNITYHVRTEASEPQTIALKATADADVQELFWFLGERYLGKSAPGMPFLWTAEPGSYQLRAVDDQGRVDTLPLHVAITD